MRLGAPITAVATALLLSTATGLAQAVPADPNAPAAGASATADTSNKDDMVTCRYEKTTGSNFTRRVCHTQREWRQMNVDAKDLLDRLDNGRQDGGSGG